MIKAPHALTLPLSPAPYTHRPMSRQVKAISPPITPIKSPLDLCRCNRGLQQCHGDPDSPLQPDRESSIGSAVDGRGSWLGGVGPSLDVGHLEDGQE